MASKTPDNSVSTTELISTDTETTNRLTKITKTREGTTSSKGRETSTKKKEVLDTTEGKVSIRKVFVF